MSDAILVLNSGSSSIKIALFEVAADCAPKLLCSGLLDEHEAEPLLIIRDTAGELLFQQHRHEAGDDDEALLADALNWVDGWLAADDLIAVGHRIVHGGMAFAAPVLLDEATLEALQNLTPLAPLHQPRCLSPVRMISAQRPELPQIGCFDTAFHAGLPASSRRFAIPRELHDSGVRRYGFHGLSFAFIADRLQAMSPSRGGARTVVAHLGSGASLCAMRDGVSIDTTMGLTPLDGLMMGTRSGAIDPGVLLYLQRARHMSADSLEDMLYRESGLLGVSGLSADMRVLLASDDPRAAEAVDLFVVRAAKEIAAMAVSLGGLECLVFTGGIGQHAAEIRRRICELLRWLGIDIDASANAETRPTVSTAASRVEVLVIATSEETMIARHCQDLLPR